MESSFSKGSYKSNSSKTTSEVTSSKATEMRSKFYHMDADPNTINRYLKNLGVLPTYCVHDVVGFNEESLPLVPQPALAVILMYPVLESDDYDEAFSLLEETDSERKRKNKNLRQGLYYIRQNDSNTSGTIALANTVANNFDTFTFQKNSILRDFINSTRDLTSSEKSEALEQCAAFNPAYEKAARDGDKGRQASFKRSHLHFVTLVAHKNYLWRIDGRDKRPFRVNITNKFDVLENAALYANEFARRNRLKGLQTFAALSVAKRVQ